MAEDLIFFPLLKKGFQYSDDGGDVEAEIEDLRQHKVTKFFAASDTLEAGEIAEYQGEDDAVNGLENGYFYKKNNQPPQTVNVCRLYVDVPGIDFLLTAGDYIEDGTESETVQLNTIETSLSSTNFYTYIGSYIDVGTIICKSDKTQNPYSYTTVINVTQDPPDYKLRYFCDDGTDFTIVETKGSRIGDTLYLFKKDGATIKMLQNQYWSPVAAIAYYNNKLYPLLFMPWQTGSVYIGPEIGYYTQKTIIPASFIRVNTQPPTPGITEENGTLKVSFPVQFEDDVTVKGTQTVVHTEEIESENDYIELRADNPLGLANGERSGLEVNNYDGNGTDCVLAVDETGWARVGDKNGTLQKLATIEDNPTDGGLVEYDAMTKELKTTQGYFIQLNKSLSCNSMLTCGRITGSGNYLNFTIYYPFPATSSNFNLNISNIIVYANGQNVPGLLIFSNQSITLLPNFGILVELELSNSETPYANCNVIVSFTLTYTV